MKKAKSTNEDDLQEKPQKKLKSELIPTKPVTSVSIAKTESDDEPLLFSFQSKGKSLSSKTSAQPRVNLHNPLQISTLQRLQNLLI